MRTGTKIAFAAFALILLLATPILLNRTPNQGTPQALKAKYDKIQIGDTLDHIQTIMKSQPTEPLQTNPDNDDAMIQENVIRWKTGTTSQDSNTATLSIFVKQGEQRIHAKSFDSTSPAIPPEQHFLSLQSTIQGNYNAHVFEVVGEIEELEHASPVTN